MLIVLCKPLTVWIGNIPSLTELLPKDKAVLSQVLIPFVHLPLLFHHVLQHLPVHTPHVVLLVNASKPGFCAPGFKSCFELAAAAEGKILKSEVTEAQLGGNTGAPDGDLVLKACP